MIAMRIAVMAGIALASPATALPSKAAVRISPNMSRSLLLAAPSVPNATLIPAARHRAIGQSRLPILDWTPDNVRDVRLTPQTY